MRSSTAGVTETRTEAEGRDVARPELAGRLQRALEDGAVILTAGAGFGKTTVLETAVRDSGMKAAWVSCSEAERIAGAFLMRIVSAVAGAAPGASDVLAERLAMGLERIDVLAATRELSAELSRLLVDPLVLVVDDAEHLDGAKESLQLLSELLRAESPALRLAVASRKQLDLRVAKPRAAGRLTDFGAADLAFDSEECEALLRARSGVEFTPEQVEEVMTATEGWPLGIALAGTLGGRGGQGGTMLADLVSASDLRAYLSEELLDSLDPELRAAAVRSSIASEVSPAVATALGLPEDFGERLERSGMLIRRVEGGEGGFAYHPLLRELLSDRLAGEHGAELAELHATVAPAVAESGDTYGAIEHWLLAERWAEAVAAIEREGPSMLRMAPELMDTWISLVPTDVSALPTIQLLKGQIEWGAGRHDQAAATLRRAVEGHRAAEDPHREWLARYFLAEALFSAGEFEELIALADGWDEPDAPSDNSVPAGLGWYRVLGLTALGRYDEARDLAQRLRSDERAQARFSYLDELSALLVALPAGGASEALRQMRGTVEELERNDPLGRLSVALAVMAMVHLDIGEVEEAQGLLERCAEESERLGLAFVARDAHLRQAMLLAERGAGAEAELEMARAGSGDDAGWRTVSGPSAEAMVADAHGRAAEAIEAARRALERVRPGLACFRVWTTVDMAPLLARNGAPEEAFRSIEEALSVVDELFAGTAGGYHRARLLAARACLQFEAGERSAAYASLRAAWDEAGDTARHVARAQWETLRPVLWQALADGELDPTAFLPALREAFPGGDALLAFTDHPRAAVRGAVLPVALAADHPAVLSDLEILTGDDDSEVAAAAVATRERLAASPPPLRFELFGAFRVSRGRWEIPEERWERPIDMRLVRFLLVQPAAVPEDMIFEALWPELSATSARRSLQVSVSRIRRVLDLPFASTSAIESRDRSYRLRREGGKLDTEEFEKAATLALDRRERNLLERARSLWRGEPLAEERYSDWAAFHRERLMDRYIAVLSTLIGLLTHAGDLGARLDVARELVDLDPVNEGAHRALIAAYARSGRRGQALRQYLECRRALVEELGVEPETETARLQARILAGESV